MEEDAREERLRDRQDGRVYPVGRALRATFDADNHHSLGNDVTGLMLDLTRVPDSSAEAAPAGSAEQAMTGVGPPSIFARIGGLLGWKTR